MIDLPIIMREQHKELSQSAWQQNIIIDPVYVTSQQVWGPILLCGRFRREIYNLVTYRLSNSEVHNLPFDILAHAKLNTFRGFFNRSTFIMGPFTRPWLKISEI